MSILDSHIEKYLKEGVELHEKDIKWMLAQARSGSFIRDAIGVGDFHRAVPIRIEEETAAKIKALIPETLIVNESTINSIISSAKSAPDRTEGRDASKNALFNFLEILSRSVHEKILHELSDDDLNALHVEVQVDPGIKELAPEGPTGIWTEEILEEFYIHRALAARFGLSSEGV